MTIDEIKTRIKYEKSIEKYETSSIKNQIDIKKSQHEI